MAVSRASVILLAVGIDLLMGEPDERWHPVVWMGRMVSRLERSAPKEGPAAQLAYGAATEALCLAAVAIPAIAAERLGRRMGLAGALLVALALKPVFAVRALFEHGRRVELALETGDLRRAREAVGRIVSRDVSVLDEHLVAAAAVESLAENASDSVVAPLVYYSLFGLPGAYLYRMANTLDAMLGYRGTYEYLGKAAARLDDLLNLVPARLTALAVLKAAGLRLGSPEGAWRAAIRDRSLTASPNAGWPMAAAAGALEVRLEKTGHYALNPDGRLPVAADIGRARRLMSGAIAIAVAVSVTISAVAGRWSRRARRGETSEVSEPSIAHGMEALS